MDEELKTKKKNQNVRRFEDLAVGQKAANLAIDIYKISNEGRLKYDQGMRDQIRRSATSISSNIAEGYEYSNNRDLIRFLRYSKGSAGESRNQLYILQRIGYIEETHFEKLYNELIEISKQLSKFIKYLQTHESQ